MQITPGIEFENLNRQHETETEPIRQFPRRPQPFRRCEFLNDACVDCSLQNQITRPFQVHHGTIEEYAIASPEDADFGFDGNATFDGSLSLIDVTTSQWISDIDCVTIHLTHAHLTKGST